MTNDGGRANEPTGYGLRPPNAGVRDRLKLGKAETSP